MVCTTMGLAALPPELPPEVECEVGVSDSAGLAIHAAPLAAEEDEYAQPTEGGPREEDKEQRAV